MPCLGGPLTKAEEAAYKVKHNNRKRGGQDQGVKQTKPRAPLTAEQQKIVADNMGMICRIAGKRTQQLRACGFNIDYDTVLSGCMLGAVDAAYRFDESRGIRFSTFASRRVWNQVNDDLRQSDETYHRNGGRRGPHNDCRVITESQIKKTCTENRQPESLFARKQADFAGFDDTDNSESFKKLVNKISLGARDRMILTGLYQNGLTMQEVADAIGITESFVSKIHGDLMAKAKSVLTGMDEKGERNGSPKTALKHRHSKETAAMAT